MQVKNCEKVEYSVGFCRLKLDLITTRLGIAQFMTRSMQLLDPPYYSEWE